MKKMLTLMFIVGLSITTLAHAAGKSDEKSPVGLWKTIDDVTGEPKAIVQIWETPEKVLHGRILKVFNRPGVKSKEFCTACPGEKHNKRIVGMTILENLKPNKDNKSEWGDGQILDPKNGKTYNCFVRLTEEGKKLDARGYIGLPLFGRTQTWLRVKDFQTA